MIICLSAWKGSGKDTIADYLIEKHNAIRVALADPLKDMVAEEYGIDRASLDDPKRKESPLLHLPVDPQDKFTKMVTKFMAKEFRTKDGKAALDYITEINEGVILDREGQSYYETVYHTPRSLAILKGSTNRVVRSDYWTNKTFEKIETILKENPNRLVVVTDLRYQSEVSQFKERFANKATFVKINRFEKSPSQDPSERDLDHMEFDFYIENVSDLSYLYSQIEGITQFLK